VVWKVVLEQSLLVYFGYLLPGSCYKFVFSYLISIKGSKHIGTQDNTMHCSTVSEILSHSVQCVCVHKGMCMHAHIDTKHDTVNPPVDGTFYCRCITEISTVSQESVVL
jgi:hypothetical protein